MSEAIFGGVSIGLLLIFMIGPVFFSLLQTSIERGFLAGASMALGIAASDGSYIFVAFWGLSESIETYESYLGPVGGSIFILMGLFTAWKNKGKINFAQTDSTATASYFRYVLKGFVINSASPFVILFWIATVGSVTSRFDSTTQVTLFFMTAIITVLIGDILKSAAAFRLKKILTIRLLKMMNYAVALILVVAGIRLLFVEINI